jgi:prepilin-type N-terminal cleavage/methylation domain-containing protein
VAPRPESNDKESMRSHPRTHRLAGDAGFTLIELLIVLVIVGILLSIAVPSYLGYRDRAIERTALSNLRQALPAAELYYAVNDTYVGMTRAELLALNLGLSPDLDVASASASDYCLTTTVKGRAWSVSGPGPGPGDFVTNATCA